MQNNHVEKNEMPSDMSDIQFDSISIETTKKNNFFINDAFKIFFVTLLVSIFAGVILVVIMPFENASDSTFWIVQLLYTLCIGLTAVIYSKVSGKDFFVANKLKTAPKLLDILLMILAIFFLLNGMIPVNQWILETVFGDSHDIGVGFTLQDLTENFWIAIPTICIVAPIAEELVFRGAIGYGLQNSKKSKLPAILLGGVLFSLFHMNPAQTLHQFVLGATLVFFASFGSLWIAIIGHIFNNALAILLAFTLESEDFYLENALLCAIVGLLMFAVLVAVKVFLSRKDKKNQQYDQNISPKTTITSIILLSVAVVICLAFWLVTAVAG